LRSDAVARTNSFEALLAKIDGARRSGNVDLSADEDLSVAVMNLVSLEEHFFFTGMRTGDDHYYDLLDDVRETRKALLARLIDRHEGETWCAAKHLLAASMRLIEVGTKLRATDKVAAKTMFERAYQLYSMFWALRLKLVDTAGLRQSAAEEKPWTMQDIVTKLVNCCDE
jgi:hypothetical protein